MRFPFDPGGHCQQVPQADLLFALVAERLRFGNQVHDRRVQVNLHVLR